MAVKQGQWRKTVRMHLEDRNTLRAKKRCTVANSINRAQCRVTSLAEWMTLPLRQSPSEEVSASLRHSTSFWFCTCSGREPVRINVRMSLLSLNQHNQSTEGNTKLWLHLTFPFCHPPYWGKRLLPLHQLLIALWHLHPSSSFRSSLHLSYTP